MLPSAKNKPGLNNVSRLSDGVFPLLLYHVGLGDSGPDGGRDVARAAGASTGATGCTEPGEAGVGGGGGALQTGNAHSA